MLLLTGAHDKESLLNYLDQLGITGGWYNSKDDEVSQYKIHSHIHLLNHLLDFEETWQRMVLIWPSSIIVLFLSIA